MMGLSYQSTGKLAAREKSRFKCQNDPVIALTGNPNTGKSTLFNALTGLRQHTGNWPGKTVLLAEGRYIHNGRRYTLVDLPGTYSLLANSVDEEVARDFICFNKPDATVVVVDATCLERNLNLALQVMEITEKVVVCVNLIDEARRKNIRIDIDRLGDMLGVPVVATAACNGEGVARLMDLVSDVVDGRITPSPKPVRYTKEVEEAVSRLEPKIREVVGDRFNPRWLALRLLDGDAELVQAIKKHLENQTGNSAREVLA